MENQRIKNILADSLSLTEIKGKKSFLKILQTVETFLLLQKLGENFQSFHFCSWCKQHSLRTPIFLLCMGQKIIKSTHLLWWWIVFVVWLTDVRRLTLFPAGNIVRNSHHPESLSCHEQDLNLPRTWFQASLNEIVQ